MPCSAGLVAALVLAVPSVTRPRPEPPRAPPPPASGSGRTAASSVHAAARRSTFPRSAPAERARGSRSRRCRVGASTSTSGPAGAVTWPSRCRGRRRGRAVGHEIGGVWLPGESSPGQRNGVGVDALAVRLDQGQGEGGRVLADDRQRGGAARVPDHQARQAGEQGDRQVGGWRSFGRLPAVPRSPPPASPAAPGAVFLAAFIGPRLRRTCPGEGDFHFPQRPVAGSPWATTTAGLSRRPSTHRARR